MIDFGAHLEQLRALYAAERDGRLVAEKRVRELEQERDALLEQIREVTS